MLEENVDYQLIPKFTGDESWAVRILSGEYNEVVLSFGSVIIDGGKGFINFDYQIIETPDDNISEEDESLQEFVSEILESLLLRAIEDKSVKFFDKETGESVVY